LVSPEQLRCYRPNNAASPTRVICSYILASMGSQACGYAVQFFRHTSSFLHRPHVTYHFRDRERRARAGGARVLLFRTGQSAAPRSRHLPEKARNCGETSASVTQSGNPLLVSYISMLNLQIGRQLGSGSRSLPELADTSPQRPTDLFRRCRQGIESDLQWGRVLVGGAKYQVL